MPDSKMLLFDANLTRAGPGKAIECRALDVEDR